MRFLPVSFEFASYGPPSGLRRFDPRFRMLSSGLAEKRKRQSGFSLIELLIVVAIILIILAIALPQVNKIQMNAREMAAVAQIRTLLTPDPSTCRSLAVTRPRLPNWGRRRAARPRVHRQPD